MATDLLRNQVHSVYSWFESRGKPFLLKTQPKRSEEIARLDKQIQQLIKGAEELARPTELCFLGNSGVGKSTLINAIVAGNETILPNGGVGPLTAQAISVRHGPQPSFIVSYQGRGEFNQLVFGLNQICIRASERAESESPVSTADELGLESGDANKVLEAINHQTEGFNDTNEGFVKPARLMVTGNQDGTAPLPYLVDGLRTAMNLPTIYGTEFSIEVKNRLDRIREALKANANPNEWHFRCDLNGDYSDFSSELREHASGFLAPMVKQMQVGWFSEALMDGLTLVDLPGLGIAGDMHRKVTQNWIRKIARGVVLVVDHRGITQSVADLLRKSGFLNRLLYSADDPSEDPLRLFVAVVKVDDIAESDYQNGRRENLLKKKRHYFAELLSRFSETIKNQMRDELESIWPRQDSSAEKASVIENVLAGLSIQALSAVQYRKTLSNDDEDRSFLENAGDSGVPQFIEQLRSFSRNRQTDRDERMRSRCRQLYSQIDALLDLTQAQWQENRHATEEVERLRADLLPFLQPRRDEFANRQGAMREFLRETVPLNIEKLVNEAAASAEREIHKYLRNLRDVAHVRTLQAAVKRGGTFHGSRRIELPHDFALTFEGPIAEVWGKKILKMIRQRTKEFGEDSVILVDDLVGWARNQGARVAIKLVEAQRDAVKADSRRLAEVGKDIVNDLRQKVMTTLIPKIEEPIRKQCQQFVARNQNQGTGLTNRIFELFGELARSVSETSAKVAKKILLNCYQEVIQEIAASIDQLKDPITATADSIVQSHEQIIKRSDTQTRKRVLEEWQSVTNTRPWSPCDVGDNHSGGVVA